MPVKHFFFQKQWGKINQQERNASYIIIQGFIIQLFQLGLVVSELDSIQYLCEQEDQGIFVPREEGRANVKGGTVLAVDTPHTHLNPGGLFELAWA